MTKDKPAILTIYILHKKSFKRPSGLRKKLSFL